MSGRVVRSIGVLVATWVGAVLALCSGPPHLAGPAATWSGDGVARLVCWVLVAAYAAWLTVFALACSAVAARHGVTAARRVAHWAPPIGRRALRAALAGTLAVAPTAPPLTLHVGPDGRLSGGRDPAPTRPTTPPTTAAPRVPAPSRPPPHPPRPTRPPQPRRHRVEAGDNLWTIARSELARRAGRTPNDRDIVPYWLRVVAANRATLRSGDPNLIYPGEIVALPNP